MWSAFNWGSRGAYWDTGIGVYVADRFISQCVQVNIFGRYADESDLENIFHVRSPVDPVDFDTVDDIAQAVATWCNLGYADVLPVDIHFTRVVATAIDRVNGPQSERIVTAAGSVSGQMLPATNTLAVKKAGTTRGRRRRGRWYTWPTVKTNTTNNKFNDDYVADVVSQLNQLLTNLDTAGFPMVIGSLTDEQMWDISTFVAVDNSIDSMRRRALGRGR